MSESSGQSRVLTLVFTDLADSTALKSERGDSAVGDLISMHRDHVTRLAAECSGRIIDWAGDGCFLTFETATSGVLYSLRLQNVHAEDTDLPGVRIGVHLGEVDKAFEYLERAYEQRSFGMLVLETGWSQDFDPYRDDPRFQAIVDRINFPEPENN